MRSTGVFVRWRTKPFGAPRNVVAYPRNSAPGVKPIWFCRKLRIGPSLAGTWAIGTRPRTMLAPGARGRVGLMKRTHMAIAATAMTQLTTAGIHANRQTRRPDSVLAMNQAV